jgi:ppGpp synthetase/RelA/SpoT-type nucleotidyltranferase
MNEAADDRAAPVVNVISDEQWSRAVEGLRECGPRMEDLVRSVLHEGDLRAHTVTHRIKRREVATRKIERKARADYSLADITDLLGLRVITYFDYEVDQVAEIIEEEFTVDRANSVDKRTVLDPDRFGYLSLHYVVRLSPSRRRLPEYRKLGEIAFEIQIRSILQHAWAEIEHDLGYKSEQAIPAQVRRRFSRLAGLLELADEEFAHIRQDLARYEEEVEVAVRENTLNVRIDRDSVAAYIRESPRLTALEEKLAKSLGSTREARVSPLYAEARANELQAVGFQGLNEIDRMLQTRGEYLWRFVRNWFRRPEREGKKQRPSLNAGVILLYLAVAEATRRPEPEASQLLSRMGVGTWNLDRLITERGKAEAEAARG